METGRLLPGASSEQRQLFFDAVCSFKRQIPSLSTFFNDMRYLGGCARYIKHLVKVERDSTVRQSLRYIFQGDENSACVIQSTDKNFHKLPVSTVEEQFDIAQRQLWLCAMRKSLASPVVPKSQQALFAKSKRPSEDRITLKQLALVAQSLGFHSSQIYQLASGDLPTEIATETLVRIQKQLNYTYGGGSLQPGLKAIVDQLQDGAETQTTLHPFVTGGLKETSHRSGFPSIEEHERDKNLLFFDDMHRAYPQEGGITSFFVRMCVYRVIFGDLQVQHDPLHLKSRPVSLARHSSENSRPTKKSRTDGQFKIFLVADDADRTSLKEIEGNGDESHVQHVAAAIRNLMSDRHPYDASSGSCLSIDDCFQSAINNSGKILMRRVG